MYYLIIKGGLSSGKNAHPGEDGMIVPNTKGDLAL